MLTVVTWGLAAGSEKNCSRRNRRRGRPRSELVDGGDLPMCFPPSRARRCGGSRGRRGSSRHGGAASGCRWPRRQRRSATVASVVVVVSEGEQERGRRRVWGIEGRERRWGGGLILLARRWVAALSTAERLAGVGHGGADSEEERGGLGRLGWASRHCALAGCTVAFSLLISLFCFSFSVAK
jgi:hypothetical protein